jgi:hypothetical protein
MVLLKPWMELTRLKSETIIHGLRSSKYAISNKVIADSDYIALIINENFEK